MDLRVWDLFVRFFHWSLVTLFAANALIIDDDTKIHQWVGYVIVGLVLARVLWGFIGSDYARFSSFPPDVKASLGQAGEFFGGKKTVHKGHSPLGSLMIYNLIASLLIICLSGYLMTTDMFWGVEWPEQVHELAVTWTELCVVLHIAAVFFESIRTGVNLPRAMITGYKTFRVRNP